MTHVTWVMCYKVKSSILQVFYYAVLLVEFEAADAIK